MKNSKSAGSIYTFKKRYEKQLQIYRKALEKLLNKKVEKSYIYSFYLDKIIEVNFNE